VIQTGTCIIDSAKEKLAMRIARLLSGLLLLVVLLAGCGITAAGGASSASTASPTPTATPAPTIAPALLASCFGSDAAQTVHVVQSGDLLLTQPQLGGLAYPAVMLPATTPATRPYPLESPDQSAYQTDFPNSPITNPSMDEHGGGFQFAVCNISRTSPHVLMGVSARLVAVTPYSGQLNQWQGCDGTLSSHHQFVGGGCGGGIAGCVCFRATFPETATVGTEVPMVQTGTSLNDPGDGLGKLPFSLGPGRAATLLVGTAKPKAPATYSFTFGLTFDQGAAVYTPTSPAVLLAPIAHSWTGNNCEQPAMLAQITATSPETYYICA
jgi:hypothetical protein